MRWILAPLALIAGIGLAQAQPLAPGEIELHIEALGLVEPDTATVPINLIGVGADEKTALADLRRKEKDLFAALARLGIARDKVALADERGPVYAEVQTVAIAPPAPVAASAAADAAAAAVDAARAVAEPVAESVRRPRMVTITVENLTKLPDVIALAGQDDYYPTSQLSLYLRDPEAARTRAAGLAIANARSEAEGYAAAMGYRVVRMLRVSNAKPGLNLADIVSMVGGVGGGGRNRREELRAMAGSISAGAQVDFVIAPK